MSMPYKKPPYTSALPSTAPPSYNDATQHNGPHPHHPNNPFAPPQSFPAEKDPSASTLDLTDEEMLAEAHEDEQQRSPPPKFTDTQENAALDESLSWIPHHSGLENRGIRTPLELPVVIPQTAPGLQQSFSRAWAPILAHHGIQQAEFLAFLDHLNVCKAASPPLQAMNLAGMVLGFMPIPFAPLVGLGTNVIAGAAMYGTARVRITRYLERANKEYFIPRGLLARIAKQNTLPQTVGQSENAPLLAPLPAGAFDEGGPAHMPSLRDRRLNALGSHIARLEFVDLPARHEESNMLDKVSAKMVTRKAEKQEHKMDKKGSKRQEKLMRKEMKIERKMEKVEYEEHGARQQEKLMKLEGKLREKQGKSGIGGEKETKAARKFLFVVVQNVPPPGGEQDGSRMPT